MAASKENSYFNHGPERGVKCFSLILHLTLQDSIRLSQTQHRYRFGMIYLLRIAPQIQ